MHWALTDQQKQGFGDPAELPEPPAPRDSQAAAEQETVARAKQENGNTLLGFGDGCGRLWGLGKDET